jgi:hypothetical protein
MLPLELQQLLHLCLSPAAEYVMRQLCTAHDQALLLLRLL